MKTKLPSVNPRRTRWCRKSVNQFLKSSSSKTLVREDTSIFGITTTTVDKEHATTIVYKEHATTTVDKEHATTTVYKEHATTTVDKEHAITTVDKEHTTTTVDKEHTTVTCIYVDTTHFCNKFATVPTVTVDSLHYYQILNL